MVLIDGSVIQIPQMRKRTRTIIDSMVAILSARHKHEISRRVFLHRWDNLRKALFLTRDYQELRSRVWTRCGGICEECDKGQMVHVHHIERVAMNPERALDDSNCLGLCLECHKKEH